MKSKIPLLIFVIIVLFSSCAVSKYDYYYSTIESDNINIRRRNRTNIVDFKIDTIIGNMIENEKEVSFVIRISSKEISFQIRNEVPIYIDFQKSSIKINERGYKIMPRDSNFADIKLFEPSYFPKGRLTFEEIGLVPFFITDSLHRIYNSDQYKHIQGSIAYENNVISMHSIDSIRQSKWDANFMEFTKENSPFKIIVSLVYYSNIETMQTLNLNFYQSSLIKSKNLRYNNERNNPIYHTGEEIALAIEDISFYTKDKVGLIYGWPEIRYGLGWTTTAITLPVTVPINLVYVLIDGTEQALIHYPLFE